MSETTIEQMRHALALVGAGLVRREDGGVIVTYSERDWRAIQAAIEHHVGDVNEWLAEREDQP